jgi:ABC-type polysaccharide/polyol phosphate export permease
LDWRTTGLLITTVVYYLGVGSLIHTHIRYGLPMHALLTLFAGLALWRLKDFAFSRKLSSLTEREVSAAQP